MKSKSSSIIIFCRRYISPEYSVLQVATLYMLFANASRDSLSHPRSHCCSSGIHSHLLQLGSVLNVQRRREKGYVRFQSRAEIRFGSLCRILLYFMRALFGVCSSTTTPVRTHVSTDSVVRLLLVMFCMVLSCPGWCRSGAAACRYLFSEWRRTFLLLLFILYLVHDGRYFQLLLHALTGEGHNTAHARARRTTHHRGWCSYMACLGGPGADVTTTLRAYPGRFVLSLS